MARIWGFEELNEDNYKEQSKFEVSPNFLKDIEGTHTYNFSNGLLVLFLKTSKKKKKIIWSCYIINWCKFRCYWSQIIFIFTI